MSVTVASIDLHFLWLRACQAECRSTLSGFRAIVASRRLEDQQFIAAWAKFRLHLGLRRRLPVGVGEDEFAIEENFRSVVASNSQYGLLHRVVA